MERMKNVFIAIGGLLFLAIVLFLGSETMASPPNNAIVLLKHDTKEMLAPPCLNPDYPYEDDDRFEVATLELARELDYEGDNCSRNALYPSRSTIAHYVLEPLGILKPLKRWDEDGNWTH